MGRLFTAKLHLANYEADLPKISVVVTRVNWDYSTSCLFLRNGRVE